MYFFRLWHVTGSKESVVTSFITPCDKSELRSFHGMTIFSARFIPSYAIITVLLRDLTPKNTKWNWSAECQRAFETLKTSLSASPDMSYFNTQEKTELIVNASPVGLGAILAQRTNEDSPPRIVAYAPRALSVTIRNTHKQSEKL